MSTETTYKVSVVEWTPGHWWVLSGRYVGNDFKGYTPVDGRNGPNSEGWPTREEAEAALPDSPSYLIASETREQLIKLMEQIEARWLTSSSASASDIERSALSLLPTLKVAPVGVPVGIGELGLPFTVAGSVAQALGQVVIDRDNATEEEVVSFFGEIAATDPLPFGEDAIWDQLGPLVDQIEDAVLAKNHKQIKDGEVVPA